MPARERADAPWRAVFLRGLARGLSVAHAARTAGVIGTRPYQVRKIDPALAAAWDRAVAEGRARLVAAAPLLKPDEVVRGSRDGRPRVQRSGPKRWSAGKERIFLETLAVTANVSAACRAAGVSNVAVYNRRERDPAFAERWRSTLDQGWHHLEAAMLGAATAAFEGGAGADGEGVFVAPMTVDQAITVYRMHQASVTGEGRRGRHDWRREPASLEEIRAEVLRRVRVMGGGDA